MEPVQQHCHWHHCLMTKQHSDCPITAVAQQYVITHTRVLHHRHKGNKLVLHGQNYSYGMPSTLFLSALFNISSTKKFFSMLKNYFSILKVIFRKVLEKQFSVRFICSVAALLAGRPVSCKPLDSFFTPSDWTRHDRTARLTHPSENGK